MKKGKRQYSVLKDRYVPAFLPSYGLGLESFVSSPYSILDPEISENIYNQIVSSVEPLVGTTDRYSDGSELDAYIDSDVNAKAVTFRMEQVHHEHQNARIRAARETRKTELQGIIARYTENAKKLSSEVEALGELHPQFSIRIGQRFLGVGLPITVTAMIVDALLNYGFLESILLSNKYLLIILVMCLSLMSDGCSWALAKLISHRREQFMPRALYYTTCVALGAFFLLSVVAGLVLRFGSMDATFGTINSAGQFIPAASYSLAEYAATLVMGLSTAATGLLSFAFSVDENAYAISIREKKKKELLRIEEHLRPLVNELSLLERAPDPQERDDRMRSVGEQQLETLRQRLKLHARKSIAIQIGDPDFTEQMAASGQKILGDVLPSDGMPVIPLSKVS